MFPFPSSPGEGVEPEEDHLAGEGGEHLRGQVLGLQLQVNVLRPKESRQLKTRPSYGISTSGAGSQRVLCFT